MLETNLGKASYADYLKAEEKKLAPIRRARMQAALEAKRVRENSGIRFATTKSFNRLAE